ncbi:MAG TPA: tyrosine-type recombinase/integrase, partial [Gammaproteobacteria bacterium]|nr:tyrosine-type recombinase/integrase [Gammaproteobacteria bacterium]
MATITPRKRKNGQTHYRAEIRLRGYPPQSATFERRTDAKRWAQQTETGIREGRYFKTVEASKHTLTELIDRYKRDVMPGKGPWQEHQAACLEWWKRELGAYRLSDVTPILLAEYRDRLSRTPTRQGTERSRASVNRYLASLSHVFTIGVSEWGWLDDNALRKVRRLTEPRGRARFLSDDERKRLLEACKHSRNPHLYTVVVIALSTGARKNELLSLRWKDVDLKHGAITLERTKNGERRALALAGHALALVRALTRHIDTPLMFPSSRDPQRAADVREAFQHALAVAAI